jgi:diadenosine tetraphosphate (Ap4A) HIT family hydrolase
VKFTEATRTYTANWAENTPHVHFHIVPRLPSLPPKRLGWDVFQMMSDQSTRPPTAVQEQTLSSIAAHVTALHKQYEETVR